MLVNSIYIHICARTCWRKASGVLVVAVELADEVVKAALPALSPSHSRHICVAGRRPAPHDADDLGVADQPVDRLGAAHQHDPRGIVIVAVDVPQVAVLCDDDGPQGHLHPWLQRSAYTMADNKIRHLQPDT